MQTDYCLAVTKDVVQGCWVFLFFFSKSGRDVNKARCNDEFNHITMNLKKKNKNQTDQHKDCISTKR